MTDRAVIMASAEKTIKEIGTQTKVLGTGLQNVGLGSIQTKVCPNKSVEYLLAISDKLSEISEQCGKLLAEELMKDSQTHPRIK